MNAWVTLLLLVLALFTFMNGEIFFAFILFLALIVGLLLESSESSRAARGPPAAQPPSMMGQTDKSSFGGRFGEEEVGKRFGHFFNFVGAIFGAFWKSFGNEPPKKTDNTPKIIVELKK